MGGLSKELTRNQKDFRDGKKLEVGRRLACWPLPEWTLVPSWAWDFSVRGCPGHCDF